MLPKENRLKKKKDFEQVFKKGRGFKEDFLFLKINENDLKESRFGFIVSREISKKAVVRNKIKRRLRETMKEELPKIKSGIDGVLVVKKGAAEKDFLEIKKVVNSLLKKAKILND